MLYKAPHTVRLNKLKQNKIKVSGNYVHYSSANYVYVNFHSYTQYLDSTHTNMSHAYKMSHLLMHVATTTDHSLLAY